jgi:hypothetical protein
MIPTAANDEHLKLLELVEPFRANTLNNDVLRIVPPGTVIVDWTDYRERIYDPYTEESFETLYELLEHFSEERTFCDVHAELAWPLMLNIDFSECDVDAPCVPLEAPDFMHGTKSFVASMRADHVIESIQEQVSEDIGADDFEEYEWGEGDEPQKEMQVFLDAWLAKWSPSGYWVSDPQVLVRLDLDEMIRIFHTGSDVITTPLVSTSAENELIGAPKKPVYWVRTEVSDEPEAVHSDGEPMVDCARCNKACDMSSLIMTIAGPLCRRCEDQAR